MTQDLTFDSTDLGETEDFLIRAYTKMRIGGVGEDGASASPLIIGSAAAHLAAATLDAFPNNAIPDTTSTDRRDAAKPDLLRRAMAYIEDHAHNDLALTDISALYREVYGQFPHTTLRG